MSKFYKIVKDGQVIQTKTPGKYVGWMRGKIFGRLDCKTGMRMKKENRVFFANWQDAISAGYRPCKNCKPTTEDTY